MTMYFIEAKAPWIPARRVDAVRISRQMAHDGIRNYYIGVTAFHCFAKAEHERYLRLARYVKNMYRAQHNYGLRMRAQDEFLKMKGQYETHVDQPALDAPTTSPPPRDKRTGGA